MNSKKARQELGRAVELVAHAQTLEKDSLPESIVMTPEGMESMARANYELGYMRAIQELLSKLLEE